MYLISLVQCTDVSHFLFISFETGRREPFSLFPANTLYYNTEDSSDEDDYLRPDKHLEPQKDNGDKFEVYLRSPRPFYIDDEVEEPL